MKQLHVIELNNQRLLTTKQLAEAYGTNENNIKNNFNRNVKKFIQGKHYFFLEGDRLRELKNQVTLSDLVPKNTASLYLWTERGANRHCKILDTDKAWEQFDNLEETYFRVKEQAKLPSNPMDILKLTYDALENQSEDIKHLKDEVESIKNDSPLYAVECEELSNAVRKRGVKLLGGKDSYAYANKKVTRRVFKAIYKQLHLNFEVSSYKAIKRQYLNAALEIVENVDLPIVLAEEIRHINAQMSFQEVS